MDRSLRSGGSFKWVWTAAWIVLVVVFAVPFLRSQGPASGEIVYSQSFSAGPDAWHIGLNKTHTRGITWHRNILGFYGEPAPAGWSETGGRSGGYIYSEAPWYFDDNHGYFGWFHMPLGRYTQPATQGVSGADAGVVGRDLRNAVVKVSLRGRNMALKGTKLHFWLGGWASPVRDRSPADQRPPGGPSLYQQDGHRWWVLTSVPLEHYLLDGEWHEVSIRLVPDESQWTYLGLINGGLRHKIRTIQSQTYGDGTLEQVLGNGKLYVWSFLLRDVDPLDQPTGRIEIDEFSITTSGSNPPWRATQ